MHAAVFNITAELHGMEACKHRDRHTLSHSLVTTFKRWNTIISRVIYVVFTNS